jgi:hypothetical protein
VELLELELLELEQRLLELVVVELSPLAERRQRWPKAPIALLIAASAAGAGCALGFTAGSLAGAFRDHAGRFFAFLAATVLLQLFAVRLPGKGSVGVAAVGLVASAIVLGSGPAMAIGVFAALAQWLRSRGFAHRGLFDAANFCLATGAAGLVYEHLAALHSSGGVRLGAALAAGLAYTIVNHGLLCSAMGLYERSSPLAVWRERFHFARLHFLAFGAFASLAASAYAELGAFSLLAFVLPPMLLAQSMRDRLKRLRPRTV